MLLLLLLLLLLLYLFISLFVLSGQPSPWRNNFACFMSLFFFVLSRCHFFFFFFISLFLSLFCLPSRAHGETILLALCHFSFLFFFYQGVTSSSCLSLYFSLCFVRTQPSPWRNNFACFISLFFFVLSRCQMIGIGVCWVACVSLIFLSYFMWLLVYYILLCSFETHWCFILNKIK